MGPLENVVDSEKTFYDVVFIDNRAIGDVVIKKFYGNIHDQ